MQKYPLSKGGSSCAAFQLRYASILQFLPSIVAILAIRKLQRRAKLKGTHTKAVTALPWHATTFLPNFQVQMTQSVSTAKAEGEPLEGVEAVF